MSTTIEWTHRPGTRGATWNPTRGCSRVSPGCDACYAMRTARRFDLPGGAYEGLTRIRKSDSKPDWSGKVVLVPSKLDEPLRTRTPTTYFVNSMSDLFHESLSDEQIAAVFGVMAAAPRHTFQVLTKRAERMAAWFARRDFAVRGRRFESVGNEIEAHFMQHKMIGVVSGERLRRERREFPWPLPNAWIGVSVEDQQRADERIPHLLRVPAAVRFLSVEPLLGPVDLLRPRWSSSSMSGGEALEGVGAHCLIQWVIVGGESGPGARPMHPAWARSLRDQCVAAGAAFFFKQWGEHVPMINREPILGRNEAEFPAGCWPMAGAISHPFGEGLNVVAIKRVGKKAAGRLLDGREWSEFPEARRG